MGSKYRAAVIGCGRIGSEFDDDPKRDYISSHAGAYSYVKGCVLAAVCDADEGKMQKCMKRWGVSKGYKDLDEMMHEEKPEIISVCTPPQTHYDVIKKIVKHNSARAIFCEKPIASNLEEARKIIDLCKEHGIILQVDHQRRFDKMHQSLRELITNKILGEAQQVNFYYTAGIKNTGSHMFDLLRFFHGDVDWIEAFRSRNTSWKEDDPNLDGIIKFKSGILATFQACDVKKFLIFEMNCLFEDGRIILKDSGFDIDLYKAKDSELFTGYKELKADEKPFDTGYKRNFMVDAVENLIACVKNQGRSISNGEDGLAALQMIELAIVSSENNGKRIIIN